MQGSGLVGQVFRGLGLKCWSEDGNPAFHATVKLRLRKPSNAPQGQRIGGYRVLRPGLMGLRRKKKKTCLQGPAWGPGPQGCGPGPPGAWAQTSLFANLLAKAWVSAETAASEVGTWRETKPGYPPYPPPAPPHFGERKSRRVWPVAARG